MNRPSESSPLLSQSRTSSVATLTDNSTAHHDALRSSSSSSAQSCGYTDILRDVIIGFSDGLTVPFALTAGLSSLGSTRLVIMGGLAELFSGMISMGLGAYLAAVTERDVYTSRWECEQCTDTTAINNKAPIDVEAHTRSDPSSDRIDVLDLFASYGISTAAATPLIDELCADADARARFKMDFLLRMDKPDVHRAWISGVTMGLSYLVGGLIPMVPYFIMTRVRDALLVSVAVTVATLLIFGYVKNYVAIRNHRAGAWGAAQTLIIGVLAAGTSYGIVKMLDRSDV